MTGEKTYAESVLPPATLEEVDDAWLAAALGVDGVACVDAAPLGGGYIADTYRLTLAGAPWPEVVIKLTADDPDNRAAALHHRHYEVEVGFYRDLAPKLDVAPACHWASYDHENGRYAVLIEHVADATVGDQITGCSRDQAADVLAELARLHAPRWGDPSLAELSWLNRHANRDRSVNANHVRAGLPEFLSVYGDRIGADVADLAVRFAAGMERYDRRGQNGPRTVGHGDCRAENILFTPERVWMVDWQTVFLGHGLVDVSYFLGGSLTVEDRREHEEALVRDYHARLVDQGVELQWQDCWREYRRHAFDGFEGALLIALRVGQQAGGDELVTVMAERAGLHALDLDAEALLDS